MLKKKIIDVDLHRLSVKIVTLLDLNTVGLTFLNGLFSLVSFTLFRKYRKI